MLSIYHLFSNQHGLHDKHRTMSMCYDMLVPEKEDSAGEARGANPFSFFPLINLKYNV